MTRFAMVFLAIFSASTLSAGVTYEFRSVTDGKGGSTLAGKAAVEGVRLRMDFTSGDGLIFKNGAVALSEDGGKSFKILDPGEKTYYELSLQDLLSTFGGLTKGLGGMFRMDVTNQSVKVSDAGDGGTMEGYPTRKYHIDSSYDLAMTVMGFKNSMKVQTSTDSWATEKLDPELATFIQQRGFQTGNEDFDKLIKAQTSTIRGLPLKQVTTTTMTSAKGKPTTSTTTVTVTNVQKKTIPASEFAVPAGYRETEMVLPGIPKE